MDVVPIRSFFDNKIRQKQNIKSIYFLFWNSSFDEDIMPFINNPKQKQIERIVGSIQDQVVENILVAGLPLACL